MKPLTMRTHTNATSTMLFLASLLLVLGAACAQGDRPASAGIDVLADAGESQEPEPPGSGGFCTSSCSPDKRSVVSDCERGGSVECAPTQECVDARCVDGCAAAEADRSSVGCDYYAVKMDIYPHPYYSEGCFAAFVTNTYSANARISASYQGYPIDIAKHARMPVGEGVNITYEPYDAVNGIPPGKVAILFLSESTHGNTVRCPVAAARRGGTLNGTGYASAFRIQSSVPIVGYQMMPYGGGRAAVTGASLLLPTSVWGTSYVAVNAHEATAPSKRPSMNIVASEDDTTVRIVPKVAIEGNPGVVNGGPAGVPIEYKLQSGQHLQLTQHEELTGSIVSSDKKIGVFGGHQCMDLPSDQGYCDHAEQQLPPVNALGSEYVAVPHRPRTSAPDPSYWRIVATVAKTELSYDPPGAGPATLDAGEFVDFVTDGPFVVKSQDAAHPFMLFSYMSSTGDREGYGDPDFVRVVPSSQYLDRYVFFTDPSYSETNLVAVRKRTPSGFESVSLDCAGELGGWTPLGADYEFTRIDLVRHAFEPQGKCNNGARIMGSKSPFGLTVWGWGSPEASDGQCALGHSTCYVSYGYPAGEGVRTINNVDITK